MSAALPVTQTTSPVCAVCGSVLPGPGGTQCLRCLLSLASDSGLGSGDDEGMPEGLLDPLQVRQFGDYELLEEIARGGMGVVYRARQVSLQRDVALKMILAGELAGRAARRMFQTEALAAAALYHPHIIAVYDTGEQNLQPFIAMRYVPGGKTIAHWAATQRKAGAWRSIAAVMAQVARAVAHAHERGVLHRDLKPSNILWDNEAGPQVTDFGLAKLVTDAGEGLTVSVQMLGSPAYMAPEQTGGRTEEITTVTDVYGLGAVLYELLSGKPPFRGKSALDTARQVAEDVPPRPSQSVSGLDTDLETICLKCLEKDPANRYASARELAEELERCQRGEPIVARPVHPVAHVWRWCRRNPKLALALTCFVLALLAGIGGISWQWHKAETAREGEMRALEKATATAVDLYAHAGLVAAKDGDTTRAALWFAQAAATPGADDADREANRMRWRAWRGDSDTALRAFESGIGVVNSITWRPAGDAIIVRATERPEAAVWDLPNETRWLRDVPMAVAAWAGKGDQVVSAHAKAVRLTEYPSGREVGMIPCETAVNCLAVSGDGRWIAVGAAAPFLWDPAERKTVPLPAEAGAPAALEFSRDGHWLLVTGARLRGVCALAAPGRFLFPPVECVAGTSQGFLAEGGLFIALNFANQLQARKSDTGAVVETLAGDGQLPPYGISPDGRFIARYSAGVVERPGGVRGFPSHRNRFESVDFSRDGSLLATASSDDTVRLWRLPRGTNTRALGWHQEGASAAAISPDNRLVATGQSGGGIVRIWRVTEPPAGQAIAGFPNSRIRLSRDGRFLVPSGRPDYNMAVPRTRVMTVEPPGPAGPELSPSGAIMDAAFGPDAAWVALVCSTTPGRSGAFPAQTGSGTLEFWDFRAGRRLGNPIVFPGEPRAVSLHPNGQKLAIYGARRTLYEVDVVTRGVRQLHTNAAQTNPIDGAHAGCRYSPDGRTLVAWGLNDGPVVWDCEGGKGATPPEWTRSRVMDIDFHGQHAGSGSMESVMEFLAFPGGKPLAPRIQDTNWIFVTRFSAEGNLFLTGGRGRIGHVWDWRKGRLNCPALQHDGEIFGGAFLPGTECVATSGLDKVIRFWDRRSGLALRPPLRQDGFILNLTVTPDGRTLISDTKDGGDIRLYDIATLLPPPELSPDAAQLLAEIDAAAEINRGSIEPLSPAAWLQKWRQFRAQHPRWHQWN